MILYMYIHVAPGQGLTTPRGRNFYVNRNILSLWSFVASFKKNLFEVWFYAIFFMILFMYIAPVNIVDDDNDDNGRQSKGIL